MNGAREGARFVMAGLVASMLAADEGRAQDTELEGLAGDQERIVEGAEGDDSPTGDFGESRGRVIEEIVVTAQRTEQQLRDVPISMSAFDDRFMRSQGVTDLQDVARFAPNVRVDQAGTFIQPRIRGFSTNVVVNRGLELPVGIVIDEIPYSRADYFVSGLFDLDRIEVLRGPQGQLFGANTTVGLLNLVTKNPTDELTGFVDLELGDLERRRFQGGVGGPVLPGFVNFRIAGLSDERGAYVDNTTVMTLPEADEEFGDRTRRSVRAKVDFPDLFGASLLVSYQRDDLDFGPTQRELTNVPAIWRGLMLQYDPNTDFIPNNLVGSLDQRSFRKAEIDTITAIARYDLGDWGLNLVGGWSKLESVSDDDADSAPWPATRAFVDETSTQTTVELRVQSPDLPGFLGIGSLFGRALGSTDFTGGFFYQRREQSPTSSQTDLDVPLVLLTQGLTMSGTDLETPLPLPRPPSVIEFFSTEFDQTADEIAGFGQMNWHFLDRWTLLAGIRVSLTTKEASWVQEVGPDPSIFQTIAAVDEFVDRQKNDELHTAPKVGLKFDWTDEVNLYATWSEGYQSGGFNNFSNSDQPATRVVDPALVEAWEGGSKMRLLGGAAELNVGLFWMTMEDFQLFTVAALPGEFLPVSRVINVGRLRARGVEVDSTWLPTDWLTLRGALGFNDTKYLEFPFGTCITDRPNTDGDGDDRCDLAGGPLEQAPKWEASVTPIVQLPLASVPGIGSIVPAFVDDVDLTSSFGVQYTDVRFLNDSNDPRTRQPAFFLFDGSIGLGSESQGWSLQFRVENLADERYHNSAFEGVPAGGVIFKSPSPPRTVYGGVRWGF